MNKYILLFLKASEENEIVIKLPSKSDAIRLRFLLYGERRKLKKVNEELAKQIEDIEVCLREEELTLRRRGAAFDTIFESLGIKETPPTLSKDEIGKLEEALTENETGKETAPTTQSVLDSLGMTPGTSQVKDLKREKEEKS
jgi:hypothetical protein